MSAALVMAADSWPTNSSLIADVADLGYIGADTVDLSYGLKGGFWNVWQPAGLVSNDVNPATPAEHNYDVLTPPPTDWVGRFDTAVWDGPYRMSGTRDRGNFDDRYGLATSMNETGTMELLAAGCMFGLTVTKPEGTLLVKCQDQVHSGRKVWQTHRLTEFTCGLGADLVEQFHLVRPPRPQPPGRRQVHARSNYSTLLVFRKHKSTANDHPTLAFEDAA